MSRIPLIRHGHRREGANASRNKAQSVTLLDANRGIKNWCCYWGRTTGWRESKAKERFFSHRNEFGQWDPKNQRPELWNIFNGHKNIGEHFRVFPISNWTELDVWQYIFSEKIKLPGLIILTGEKYSAAMEVYLAWAPFMQLNPMRKFLRLMSVPDDWRYNMYRCNTLKAHSLEEIISEDCSYKSYWKRREVWW